MVAMGDSHLYVQSIYLIFEDKHLTVLAGLVCPPSANSTPVKITIPCQLVIKSIEYNQWVLPGYLLRSAPPAFAPKWTKQFNAI